MWGSGDRPDSRNDDQAPTRYDNKAHIIYGGVALYGWKQDYTENNVRMSVVWDKDTDKPLEFRPFADGIIDLNFKDSNDFQVMERALCASLRKTDATDGCTDSYCTGPSGGNICIGGASGVAECH